MRRDQKLEQLGQLAALRSQRSAARLAGRMAKLTALQARDTALRAPPEGEPASLPELIARDRHDTWRNQQLARLSLELARARAEVEPFRHAHARDVAREQVIARLQGKRTKGAG
ncbi:hypothetical protein [Jannaschia sp. 2305UL9-9]|uniref:hypothetical protein n=1 Tax=Jannaschia sp. 2305UL9-9 TaxID=3121638 RepID=UPI00352773BD